MANITSFGLHNPSGIIDEVTSIVCIAAKIENGKKYVGGYHKK